MPGFARLLVVVLLATPLLAQPSAKPTFRLFLLGHEIGREVVRSSKLPDGERVTFDFSFTDRGTAVELASTLEIDADQNVRHFVTKARTSRLLHADSEVTVTDGRARVRDGARQSSIDIGGRPFFPVDNYAPIGAHERLIRYWIAKGRPAEIVAPPAGAVRITSRGVGPTPGRIPGRRWEKLAIEGAVWGRETAWIDVQTKTLQALATWAGGLNFIAVRGTAAPWSALAAVAASDQVVDLAGMGRAAAPLRTGAYAIAGATVIDGTSKAPMPDSVVIVRDGRISLVGASTAVPVPAGMPVVDGKGLFAIPGLWDMQAHVGQADWAPAYLGAGVTTIRDLGGDFEFLTRFRDAIDKGGLGPRVLLAGLVDGPGDRSFGAITAATPDEGRAVVRRYHAARFQQIRIYSLVSAETANAIVAEANKLGLTLTGDVAKTVADRPGGLSLHRELERSVTGGMTPLQAIQSATIMAARAMKLDKDAGTIEAGKRADLVLLSADPLSSIANVRAIRWVVANGRLYDPAPLVKAAGIKSRAQ